MVSRKERLEQLEQVIASNPKGRRFDEAGAFYPDPLPIAPPIGYVKSPTIVERIREMVRGELSRRAEEEGLESFEEADDFDIGEDYDPRSPYEEVFEPQLLPSEVPKAADAPGGGFSAATSAPPKGASDEVATPVPAKEPVSK